MKNVLEEYIKLQLILYDLENEYPKMSEDGKRNFKELFKMFNMKNSAKVIENKTSDEIEQQNLYNHFRKGHLFKMEWKNKWWVSKGVLRLRYNLSVPTIYGRDRDRGGRGARAATGRGAMCRRCESTSRTTGCRRRRAHRRSVGRTGRGCRTARRCGRAVCRDGRRRPRVGARIQALKGESEEPVFLANKYNSRISSFFPTVTPPKTRPCPSISLVAE